jgi:prevent-host-death family protein
MKTAPVADLKARLSAYLKESEEGPIIVTRKGKPVAVLIAVEGEDELERLMLAYSPKLRDVLESGKKQIHEAGGVEHKEFWQEVEKEG